MKLKFTTLFIALMSFMTISTYGQDVSHPITTNNGFESWESSGSNPTIQNPIGWAGSDGMIKNFAFLASLGGVNLDPKVQVSQNTADKYSGNSSAKVISMDIGDPGVQPGVLVNGKLSINISAIDAEVLQHLDQIMSLVQFTDGEPVTQRVARVYAWVKAGDIEDKDNYAIQVLLFQGSNTVPIGQGFLSIVPSSIQNWKRVRVDVTYNDATSTPDKLNLVIMSSDIITQQNGAHEGNSFLIDDVVFQYEGEEPLPIDDLHQTATLNNTDATVNWNASIKDNVASYTVQHSVNAKDWNDVSQAYDQLAGEQYRNTQYDLDNGNHFYRLKVQMLTGETEYTDVMRVDVKGNADIKVWPNPVTNGQVHLSGIPQGAGLAVYSATGQEVLRINNAQSREDLNLSSFANGVYIIKVVDGSGQSLFSKQIVK